MSDNATSAEDSRGEPDPKATAAVVQGLVRRVLTEQPLRHHGDELEVVQYVLSAWERVELHDPMQLNALMVLLMCFMPALVLSEVVEPGSDVEWLVTFEPVAVSAALRCVGIDRWCEEQGFALELVPDEDAEGQAIAKPESVEAALQLVRQRVEEPPPASAELEAHAVLDKEVANALPFCRDVFERVRDREALAGESELVRASLRLLTACRIAGQVVIPAIAWGGTAGDLEEWFVYLGTAVGVGLSLRLLAEASSPEERSAVAGLDEEALTVLSARLQEIGAGVDQ